VNRSATTESSTSSSPRSSRSPNTSSPWSAFWTRWRAVRSSRTWWYRNARTSICESDGAVAATISPSRRYTANCWASTPRVSRPVEPASIRARRVLVATLSRVELKRALRHDLPALYQIGTEP
jgi:hypothetical protein